MNRCSEGTFGMSANDKTEMILLCQAFASLTLSAQRNLTWSAFMCRHPVPPASQFPFPHPVRHQIGPIPGQTWICPKKPGRTPKSTPLSHFHGRSSLQLAIFGTFWENLAQILKIKYFYQKNYISLILFWGICTILGEKRRGHLVKTTESLSKIFDTPLPPPPFLEKNRVLFRPYTCMLVWPVFNQAKPTERILS